MFGRKRKLRDFKTTLRSRGHGLWRADVGWEVVEVFRNPSNGKFYFAAEDGHLYGYEVGGYSKDELATLYMMKKLSLSPDKMFQVSPSFTLSVAQILNRHGEPVLEAYNWEDGMEPLLADPDFHGNR